MMWNMDVSNPAAYAKAFSAFSKKIKKKYSEVGSNGIGQPIVGQTDEFSHFVYKLTGKVANYLKENPSKADETLELIHRVYQLDAK